MSSSTPTTHARGAILVVDIGNTRTCVALARGERIGRVLSLDTGHRGALAVRNTLAGVAGRQQPKGAVVGSVVPRATQRWSRELNALLGCKPLIVHHRLNLGVALDYPRPEQIGADRLANACAVAARYETPAVVADFGTALTFDVIDRRGAYVGGVIAPGLRFVTDYLAEKTAMLPAIRLRGAAPAVGRSTQQAMLLGAQVGYRGMVREIVGHLERGLGERRVTLCATGGSAEWALKGLDIPFILDRKLTLYGLARIYRLNAG